MGKIRQLLSYLLSPLLLGMHWWTEQPVWLYAFGVLSGVASLIAAGLALVASVVLQNGMYKTVTKVDLSKWPVKTAIVYQVCTVAYLVYASAVMILIIYGAGVALMWYTYSIIKHMRREIDEQERINITNDRH